MTYLLEKIDPILECAFVSSGASIKSIEIYFSLRILSYFSHEQRYPA